MFKSICLLLMLQMNKLGRLSVARLHIQAHCMPKAKAYPNGASFKGLTLQVGYTNIGCLA
jgi:hypothetical protein